MCLHDVFSSVSLFLSAFSVLFICILISVEAYFLPPSLSCSSNSRTLTHCARCLLCCCFLILCWEFLVGIDCKTHGRRRIFTIWITFAEIYANIPTVEKKPKPKRDERMKGRINMSHWASYHEESGKIRENQERKIADVFFELKVFANIFPANILYTIFGKAKRIDCTGELEKQTPIYKHASTSFRFVVSVQFFFDSRWYLIWLCFTWLFLPNILFPILNCIDNLIFIYISRAEKNEL